MRSVGSTLERECRRVANGGTLERGRSAGGTLERGSSLGGTLERGKSPGGTLERGLSVGAALEGTRSPAGTLERERRARIGGAASCSSTLERCAIGTGMERITAACGGDKSGSGSPYYSPNTTIQRKVRYATVHTHR